MIKDEYLIRNLRMFANIPYAGTTCADLMAAAANEIERLRDKALRFELDQLGIEQREREAVELVDLRAEVVRLRALADSERETVAFDHSIGEGRFQVVRGAFWWHIKIGDSEALHGKFHSKLAAEDMALKLLTAYRDGAFEQYKSRPVRAEPLTDEELRECFTSTNTSEPLEEGWPGLERFARAVERKVRGKE